MSRMPHFLVIGGMKCGTTSVYEDLRQHNDVYLSEKESGVLLPQADSDARGRRTAYDRVFAGAPAGALLGEVATTYTMSPTYPDVVERAKRVLPTDIKLVYIVREPVARIISHHHHDLSSGRIETDVDHAVREDPRLLDYTRYAKQIRPWREAFGPESMRIVRFESYFDNRAHGLSNLLEFLELPPLEGPVANAVHNASQGKPVAVGGWRRLVSHPAYRDWLRPLVPERARRSIARKVLPKAPPPPRAPRPETVEMIVEELTAEMDELGTITGEGRWWEPDTLRRRYSGAHGRA